jgi:ABC-type transporter Mla subunit MlaD
MSYMSDMSQFSVQWDELTKVEVLLTEIEREVRNLAPLLDPSAAVRASAPVAATAMNELSASLSSFVEQNASELHGDVERFNQVVRNYQNSDRGVVDSSEQMCRRPMTNLSIQR